MRVLSCDDCFSFWFRFEQKRFKLIKLYNCAHIHARFSIQADFELTGGSIR
jgi:hypothetical protein